MLCHYCGRSAIQTKIMSYIKTTTPAAPLPSRRHQQQRFTSNKNKANSARSTLPAREALSVHKLWILLYCVVKEKCTEFGSYMGEGQREETGIQIQRGMGWDGQMMAENKAFSHSAAQHYSAHHNDKNPHNYPHGVIVLTPKSFVKRNFYSNGFIWSLLKSQ